MGPQVRVQQGLVEGFVEDGVSKFYGIPYAAPPIGQLRWRAPQPAAAWDGLRDAKAFGPISVQTVGAGFTLRTTEQSEDSLTLNIWTTALDASAKQPVMVWIHGGGNLGGAGSEDAFDGARLAAKGVTAVTFNYRLGAFGFLAHPHVGANFGVLDYVAVLEWVRDNIAGFGGDPDNVTIFGESAGAVAVRTLLSCPPARGLYHRAIIQSAGFEPPAFAKAWSYERAQAAAEAVFDRLGSRDLDVLRQVPTADLKLASHELSGIFPPPGQVHTPANLVWMPVPDGEVVVAGDEFPGWTPGVPVMFGCLQNEARYFIKPSGSYIRDGLEIMAKALCGPQAGAVMEAFDASGKTAYEGLDELFTAIIWTEPALETARRFARLGRPFYYYHFNRLSPGAIATQDLVRHSAEIRYVFGNLTEDGAYDDTDRQVSEIMQDAWIAFARTGEPRGPGGLAWPVYDPADAEVAWIEENVAIRPFPVTRVMEIVNRLRSQA